MMFFKKAFPTLIVLIATLLTFSACTNTSYKNIEVVVISHEVKSSILSKYYYLNIKEKDNVYEPLKIGVSYNMYRSVENGQHIIISTGLDKHGCIDPSTLGEVFDYQTVSQQEGT